MKLYGIIPARGGSKRVPGKNLRNIGNKSLISWTIEGAINSGVFSRVIVSTDDQGIANASRKAGAEVPWLRPSELATDSSPTIDTVLHALNWLETNYGSADGVMLLQPTSPYRSVESIKAALNLFEQNNMRPVVSFSKISFGIEWCFRLDGDGIAPLLGWDNVLKRSQDAEDIYQLNGVIYLASPDFLRANRRFFDESVVPLILSDDIEALDIDTEEDMELANQIYRNRVP